VQLGCSAVELRAQPVELFLGSPAAVAGAAGGRGRGAGGAAGAGRGTGAQGDAAAARGAGAPADAAGGRRAGAPGAGRGAGAPGATTEPPCVPGAGISAAAAAAEAEPAGAAAGGRGRGAATPEQQAAQAAAAEETKKWRSGVSLDKVKEFRKKWEDAGVLIEIVKWDGIFDFSDDELDYAFQVSKALGARALSSEISIGRTKRLGQFADKHKMQVGYHGHTAVSAAIWEATFAEAKYNAANLDLGHYVAGQNASPVPFLKKHPDRITHVHVKDRKFCNGPNMPFGQGDTPIKEVLQLMRDNKWKFQATVEFEYAVPAGSTLDAELAKTLEYCRACLV
jgi:hypothetical protein